MKRPRSALVRYLTLLAAIVLVAAACGDDDDDAGGDNGEGEVVTVVLADFEFRDLPDEVDAGTRLTIENVSNTELHELVAVLLPEDEERSVEDLLQLPEDEIDALLGGGEPAMVLVQAPGSDEVIPAVGDGTLTESGRYLIGCFIPTGVDPGEFLEAAENSEGGPPEIEGAGPPHVVHGMYTELVVN